MRKPLRNTLADVPPLTPTTPISGLLTRSELVLLCSQQRDQMKRLLSQLATLRRRHDKVEAAMSKYLGLLEQEVTEKSERVQALRIALLPNLEVQHD